MDIDCDLAGGERVLARALNSGIRNAKTALSREGHRYDTAKSFLAIFGTTTTGSVADIAHPARAEARKAVDKKLRIGNVRHPRSGGAATMADGNDVRKISAGEFSGEGGPTPK